MFTGIVQTIGQITGVTMSGMVQRVAIAFEGMESLAIGASVAVNGVCLTVVAMNDRVVEFDTMEETRQKTNLDALSIGDRVNIERAARFGDEIGGHLVSGHVHGLATLIATDGNEYRFSCDAQLMKYLLPKGFVALNGASLTLVDVVAHGEFTVHLIPETRRATTFGQAKIGDRVNIECDQMTQTIVRTVERCLRG
jgi:riboflavin synthase